MNMPINREKFLAFLVAAKQHTYAAEGGSGAATAPLLPGSKQLEYRDASLLYRDVYFGGGYFVGQETVYYEKKPVWAMCYSGGQLQNADEHVDLQSIYTFLQTALQKVPPMMPYRGPATFKRDKLAYTNESHGDPDRFWGLENITYQGIAVYQLHYSGGILQP